MIYFLQSVDGGPIKIGFSDDVERRREELEAAYRQPLALLATMEGDKETESGIHARFSHLRLGRTEQFRAATDLMAFIGRPLLVDPNPDAVEIMPTRAVQKVLVSYKADPQTYEGFRKWLDDFSAHVGAPSTVVLDMALKSFAEKQGFRAPPKRLAR